jgi:hypothetical protein
MDERRPAGTAGVPYQRLFATEPAEANARERARGREFCSPPSAGARSASRAARAELRRCRLLLPTAKPAANLPTYDRLYTIIGRLKRGLEHYCLIGRGRLRIPVTGATPKFSCREDMRG